MDDVTNWLVQIKFAEDEMNRVKKVVKAVIKAGLKSKISQIHDELVMDIVPSEAYEIKRIFKAHGLSMMRELMKSKLDQDNEGERESKLFVTTKDNPTSTIKCDGCSRKLDEGQKFISGIDSCCGDCHRNLCFGCITWASVIMGDALRNG